MAKSKGGKAKQLKKQVKRKTKLSATKKEIVGNAKIEAAFKKEINKSGTGRRELEATAPATGTCTIRSAGLTFVKRGVTKDVCASVAAATGGTYTFTPD